MHAALEVDEEHVVPERGAPRPRLDAGQVHATLGQLLERVHEPAGRLIAAAPEHDGRLRTGASGLRRRSEPDEACHVVWVVLDVGDENPAAVQLGRQPGPDRTAGSDDSRTDRTASAVEGATTSSAVT